MPTAVISSFSSNKPLRFGLWVAQALLFCALTSGGVMKLLLPIARLAAMWPWTGQLPAASVRILGLIDLAGGVGVLLPALTRIKPGLTVLAALGCSVLMVFAIFFHVSRGEAANTPFNFLLLALSLFILWGRYRQAPILPRAS